MKSKGFSLIEIMIVLVIVGILIGIAYPGYRDYMTRARRSDGQAALLDLASRMERYYSEENTYASATLGTNAATDIMSSNQSPEGWYTLAITSANGNAFALQATPQNAQATNDTRCQSLTLNSQGVKGITAGPAGAPTGSAADCW